MLARSLCHIDNAYWVPNIHVHGRIAKTNKCSQTAFRGFGGPQGMIVIEEILGRCAPALGIDAGGVAAPQLLRRRARRTPYGQPVRHPERIAPTWEQVLERGEYARRQAEVAAFNAAHDDVKRGLAITPVKFGISFNLTAFNQAGALVHVYKDGSVLINHGGTEMGQGLHTKMIQVAATALGVPLSYVRLAPTRTDKVPNTSATAASSGADLNGGAIKNACEQIRERLAEVAARQLEHPPGRRAVRRRQGHRDRLPRRRSRLATAGQDAYMQRISLWAAGFYRTAGLHWDAERMQGEPFKYFAYGASLSEVEVDGYTGAYRLLRTDIVHDVGDSLSPLIDLGQIEGGFVQGAGWLTLEELRWDETDGRHRGRLNTQAASTYKIPSFSEMPEEFNVHLLERAAEAGAVYGSKAVGEPPLMLAFSVREALRQAAGAFGPAGHSVELGSPATPEAIYWAIEAARAAGAEAAGAVRRIHGWGLSGLADRPGPVARGGRARGAGDRGRSARACPARPRRQDGGRHRPDLGQCRRRQPRGDRRTPGPGDDQSRGRGPPRCWSRGSTSTPGMIMVGSVVAARSGCCWSRSRPDRRWRSSASATSASSWPGSFPGWRSSCSWSIPGPSSLINFGWPTSPPDRPTSRSIARYRRVRAGAAAGRRPRVDHDPRPRRGLRAL